MALRDGLPASWTEQRRMDRKIINLSCQITGWGSNRQGVLVNLTCEGCHIFGGTLRVGERLQMRLGEIGPVTASVMWTNSIAAGLKFETPLHPAVVDHLVKANAPDEVGNLTTFR